MADVPGYPWLQTSRDNVDVKDVNPVLLKRLNALAKSRGQVVTIFSGYRPPESPYGFKGDPHQRHIAVDATIGGQPIGLVVSQAEFVRFKLRNGNQPGFYKGKTDPSHTDLVGQPGGGVGASGGAQAPSSPQPPDAQTAATPAAFQATPQTTNPYASPPPVAGGLDQSGLLPPGAVQAGGFSPHWAAQNWAAIAAQPGSSPDSQRFLQLAQEATGAG